APTSASTPTHAPTPTPAAAPVQHVTEQPRRLSDPKPVVAQPTPVASVASAQASSTPPGKGAARLMTPTDSGTLRVSAREITPARASTPQPSAAHSETSASPIVASAPVAELVFKGPPRPPRTESPTKWIVLGVLLILGAAGGGVAWFKMQHRTVVVTAPPKEKPIEGLEMKEGIEMNEPAGHAPDTVLEA